MNRIDELVEVHGNLPPIRYRPRKPKRLVLDQPIPTTSTSEPTVYEVAVLNHLITHREALGIRKVFRLQNASADGEVELADGRRALVEIKYRMNWEKACQAGWQLLESLKLLETLKLSPKPYVGLVFFERFKGDGWDRQAASKPLQNGWYYWYAGHHQIRQDFSAVLIHFEDGALETYPELAAGDPMSPVPKRP